MCSKAASGFDREELHGALGIAKAESASLPPTVQHRKQENTLSGNFRFRIVCDGQTRIKLSRNLLTVCDRDRAMPVGKVKPMLSYAKPKFLNRRGSDGTQSRGIAHVSRHIWLLTLYTGQEALYSGTIVYRIQVASALITKGVLPDHLSIFIDVIS
jgi:hypothetical protein